jgi:hypothetical protein
MTFLKALRHDRIDAPCVLDGPIGAESFLACVEQILAPTLDPIEHVLAKLEALLRKVAERTVEATWRRIGDTSNPLNAQTTPVNSGGHASA